MHAEWVLERNKTSEVNFGAEKQHRRFVYICIPVSSLLLKVIEGLKNLVELVSG